MSHILRVNPIACEAHGMCAELLPERIALDEWGYPIVDGEPLSHRCSNTPGGPRRPVPRSRCYSSATATGMTRPLSTPPDRVSHQSPPMCTAASPAHSP